MKKLLIIVLLLVISLFVLSPLTAFANESGTVVISRDTDSVRYGKTVVYTAHYSPGTVNYTGDYMWFVNDVKQDETSSTFTYTHRESGDVVIYAKYGAIVSNELTENINYTLFELLMYYGLAIIAIFCGIPLMVALSRRDHRSPIDLVYADTKRLLIQISRLEEQIISDKPVRDIKLIRLGFSLNSATESAILYNEDTQIGVLQIAGEKLREAYNYIHGIKTSMPKDQKAEKAALARQRLMELIEAFETVVKPIITEAN